MSERRVTRRMTAKGKTDANGKINEKQTKMTSSQSHQKLRQEEKQDRESIVLWRHPITTLQYFILESTNILHSMILRLWQRKAVIGILLFLFIISSVMYNVEGTHQQGISILRTNALWCAYWVGLGILSSVGLGTGLHTFLLYLGPHIAAVTLAAYECMSVDFPEPPYPNEIVCPSTQEDSMSLWTILSKVRLEAVMWGAGTAIGELPPYFMARAARLSGHDPEDDEFEEIEELIHEKKRNPKDLNFMERAKIAVHNLVQKVGFFGILACASIPNPLFDLAGITCGHFLVPFWTFFGATLIGKAVIKMHIQKLFVIFLFSQHHVEEVVNLIGKIPQFGQKVQIPFKEYLEVQKSKLHHKTGADVASDSNVLGWIFEKVIIVMVAYFLLSIIHSTAQGYHKRLCKENHGKKTSKSARE